MKYGEKCEVVFLRGVLFTFQSMTRLPMTIRINTIARKRLSFDIRWEGCMKSREEEFSILFQLYDFRL